MKEQHLPSSRRIQPPAIDQVHSTGELIDRIFTGYNAARLREACELFTRKFCSEEVFVAASFAGALTPTGLGVSCIVPMIKNGWLDWVVSTGANLYHDIHFAMGLGMYRGSPFVDDRELHRRKIVRIYDVVFEADVLYKTDAYVAGLLREMEFDGPVGTAAIHYEIGKRLLRDFPERADYSVLATAARHKVPVFVPSPGDSTIGMAVASLVAERKHIVVDPSIDVNHTAALVYMAHRQLKGSAVLLLGGGSPKNFILQTEPYLNELGGLDTGGHNYFLQFTDARPDTGGLSGATPSEAVSWGKIREDMLSDTVVCYGDTTILLPLLATYAFEKAEPKKHSRAYDLLEDATRELLKDMKLPY